MQLPIYPHLGMTEAELAVICEELFAADEVLAKLPAQVAEHESKVQDYEVRERDSLGLVDSLKNRLDDLRAEVRAVETQIGEAHGLAASMKYHRKMALVRISDAIKRMDRRKRQLYLGEARRRLGELGKELKLGIGGFRAGKGKGTAIIDRPPKRVFVKKPKLGIKDVPGFEIEVPPTPANQPSNEDPLTQERGVLCPPLDSVRHPPGQSENQEPSGGSQSSEGRQDGGVGVGG